MSWQTWKAGLELSTKAKMGGPLEPCFTFWLGMVVSCCPRKAVTLGDELSASEAYNEGARLETSDFTRYRYFSWMTAELHDQQRYILFWVYTSEMEYLCNKICLHLTLAHNAKLFFKLTVLFTPLLRRMRIFSGFTFMLTLGIVYFHFSCFGGFVMML